MKPITIIASLIAFCLASCGSGSNPAASAMGATKAPPMLAANVVTTTKLMPEELIGRWGTKSDGYLFPVYTVESSAWVPWPARRWMLGKITVTRDAGGVLKHVSIPESSPYFKYEVAVSGDHLHVTIINKDTGEALPETNQSDLYVY